MSSLFKYLFYFCLLNWCIFFIVVFQNTKNISWFKTSIYFSLLNWFLLIFSIILFKKRKRINIDQTLITKNYLSSKINIYNKPGLYLFDTLLNSKNIILPCNFEFKDIFTKIDKQAIFIEKIKFNIEYKEDINIFNIDINKNIFNHIKSCITQLISYWFNSKKKESQKLIYSKEFFENNLQVNKYTYILKNITIEGFFICEQKSITNG